LQSFIGQKKVPIALKGYVLSHLLAPEKCITRLSKLIILVFQQAASFLATKIFHRSSMLYNIIFPGETSIY
jgi:hypothetical protein